MLVVTAKNKFTVVILRPQAKLSNLKIKSPWTRLLWWYTRFIDTLKCQDVPCVKSKHLQSLIYCLFYFI